MFHVRPIAQDDLPAVLALSEHTGTGLTTLPANRERLSERIARSIAVGSGITDAAPGSVQGLQLVVADIEAARSELLDRGVEVGDVQVFPWGSFIFFSDPDGNRWSVQQLPDRG